MKELYFVTSNEGKIKEAKMILGIPIHSIQAELEEIQSLDLEEIVKAKALKAFELVKKPLFVDDVGLYIEAWNGFPGPFIKYFCETIGIKGLLKMMKDENNRQLTAKAAIGFHNGKEVITFIGEVKGMLATEARGQSGWGWDPIFIPSNLDKTYAELTAEEKNAISHRRVALESFKKYFV